ncbi:transporter [Plantactinospora sp. GCM10030261]|uniref:transporter n=1 Tax=Plantactinospora sp. GCM10030261 TaxID=3273420 RepID=UPI0036075FB6
MTLNEENQPPASPAESLRLIQEQQAAAARQLIPDLRAYYLPWGLAWLIGFGVFFLRYGPDDRVFVDMPAWLPLAVLLALLVTAMVVSGVLSAKAYTQVSGDSSRRGGWYGSAWFLGFATLAVTLARVSGDLPDDQAGLLWAGATVGLTGALHMAGGAIWLDGKLFALGVWISIINLIGVIAGPGWHALVVSVAGGGGMLLAGVLAGLARSRR